VVAVGGVQSMVVVLVQISGGGLWGGKRQRRGTTRPRIYTLFAVFLYSYACVQNFYAHNGAILCIFVFLCL
jgi:hypothetical protein